MAKATNDAKVMRVNPEGVEEAVKEVVRKDKTLCVDMDTDISYMIEFSKKEGKIVFDAKVLPDIEKEFLNELPHGVVQDYLKAKKERDSGMVSDVRVLGALTTPARKKMMLRKRPGYHQTWKRPDEVDEAKELGYVNIRRREKEEPIGQEKGEILMLGQRNDPELVAMEIPLHRKKAHDMAMSQKSKRAYAANKDSFAASVEQVNRNLPNEDNVVIVDDERDVG